MSHSVYWIHHPDHTDIFNQGYVGVSINTKNRWNFHKKSPSNPHLRSAVKKYGWDVLVKEIILIGEKEYCFQIEKKLRRDEDTGWNLAPGGGCPPGFKIFGDDSYLRWPENKGIYLGGKNPKAMKIKVNGIIYECIKDFAKATGLNYSTARYRARTNPTKWGYEKINAL